MHLMTFFSLGNGDSCRIKLENGKENPFRLRQHESLRQR